MVNVRNGNLIKPTMVQGLSPYLREQIRLLTIEIEKVTEQQILNETEYVNRFMQKHTIQPLTPEWDHESITHAQKMILPHELDPISAMRLGLSIAHNKSYQQDVLIYKVPCSGDLNLLNMAPNTNMLASLPKLQINSGTISFELIIDKFNPGQTKQCLENYKNWIKQHIGYLNYDLTQHNTSLRTLVPNLYNKRKQQFDNISNILKSIGIPLDRSTNELEPVMITDISPMQNNKINYYSAAISYSGLDVHVATELNNFLIKNGVKTWFYPENSVPGEKLHRMMNNMINEADRVILLCSKSSLHRNGVLNELERILEREAREGGSAILIPVALDQYVFEEWMPEKEDFATQIRSRNIINLDIKLGDFKQMNRLLSALIK